MSKENSLMDITKDVWYGILAFVAVLAVFLLVGMFYFHWICDPVQFAKDVYTNLAFTCALAAFIWIALRKVDESRRKNRSRKSKSKGTY